MATDKNMIRYVSLPNDVKRELSILIRNHYGRMMKCEEKHDVNGSQCEAVFLSGAERVLSILGWNVGRKSPRSKHDHELMRRVMGCMIGEEKEDKE